MKFLTGAALANALHASIAGKRFDAAVAYWGRGAADILGIGRDSSGSRVLCDAYSGACNPREIEKLLDLEVEVLDCPGLHAKVYISPDNVIIGSANASANGLGREDLELNLGLEAAIVTDSSKAVSDARKWFDRLAGLSTRVCHEDIDRIQEAWLPRRNARPVNVALGTLENALNKGLSVFEDRRIFLVVYRPDPPPEELVECYKSSEYFDRRTYDDERTPFFWDAAEWAAEAGDLILSYEFDQGRLNFDDMWEVLAVLQDGMVVPVQSNRRPLGLEIDQKSANRLATKISSLIDEGRILVPSGYLPLSKLAELLGSGQRPVAAGNGDGAWQRAHLALITTNDVQNAYRRIVDTLQSHGAVASPNTGHVPAVRFHDSAHKYLFSCIINPRHLLFYVRNPAQRALPGLREQALTSLPKAKKNSAGEVTVRIEGEADANCLTQWLASTLS